MKIKFTQLLILLAFAVTGWSQSSTQPQNPTLISEAAYMLEVPSIASQIADGTFQEAENIVKEYNPKRRDANKAVPGKGLPKGPDPLWFEQNKSNKIKGKEPILTFQAAASNSTPTDPTGAVGPNHFVNAWNSSFRIWDKEGNPLISAASLGTIFPGQTLGDPIVMYDQFADRFIVTEFFSNGFLFAITQGPDPVNSGWYTYQFPTNSFPDYPKFSLWSDGYYITSNKNSSTAGFSEVVFVLERDKIITGDPGAIMIGFPLPTITTSGFFSPLGFNVNGNELPPPGNAPIVYMQDDVWTGVSTDHLKIWNINVDWVTPANSTISNPQVINTTPFDGLFDGGSFSNLPQPSGPDIDALQATIMYMAQYRRFADYNTVVFNFVVDLTGADNHAGIRWYELRQPNDGDPWEIYQEGTYSQPDGHSAFSGNMCMDAQGNIALAYTVVSSSQYPSLRYTGRYATDELNVMTIAEESYAEGTSSDPFFRYGDYSQMTIDPSDDKTFWSIGEYFTGGPRKNQVGVFKIAPDLANDVGIVSLDEPVNGILSNTEQITITIRNFGVDDQTNIPVYYQINDGTLVNETFTGTISSNTDAQFTFSALADLSTQGETYTIHTGTSLATDMNPENDTLSMEVTHLFEDDLGLTALIAPTSGIYLSNEEEVMVTISNFGALTQNTFDVTYIVDDGIPVTETVTFPLASEESMDYQFLTAADLSSIGYHELKLTTDLSGDQNNLNDTLTAFIVNTICQPELICDQGVGIFSLQLGTIDNVTGCDPNGYGNYTNLSTNLQKGMSHDLTISCEYGNTYVKAWIDYNDNFSFEDDEIVVYDYIIAEGQGSGNYTETIQLPVTNVATLGEHLFRVKTNYNEEVPEDPCEETTFGETEDYLVNITLGTGTDIASLEDNELNLVNQGNNNFEVIYETNYLTETMIVTVHNIQGHTVIQNRVPNINGTYRYDFDMSYAPKGVYLLRLGTDQFGKVKRFVVQ
ncbi:MAG: T9SS type A sorting domain-containing protein [Bacteroidetes bacterium]|nr:T9SS type A sorting domain-containing protein [Bacteroidota bacterium]